jgi:hypothetical protein
MFLPHLGATLREAHRVLKPGGTLTAAVWSTPEKNPYLSLPMGVLKTYIDIPPPDPTMPGLFRLAESGFLLGEMQAAGFTNLQDEEFRVEGIFSSGVEYVDCLKEMAAPLQALFTKIPKDKKADAESRIAETAESFRVGDKIRIPGIAWIVSGTRSS